MAYIIFGVVFISFCIWIYDLKKTESMTWDYYDIISAIFSSIGSSLLISFIITIPICLVMTEVYSESKYKNKTEKWNIVTLKDNNNTKGNFEMILGTGSGQVTQGLRYSTYIEKGNEIKLLTVDTDDAELKYTDDKPYVIITKQYKKIDNRKAWGILFFRTSSNDKYIEIGQPRYVFNLKKENIQQQLILDAE